MDNILLFKDPDIYRWRDIESFFVMSQYNELLNLVMNVYVKQYPPEITPTFLPTFLNDNYCLTIHKCGASFSDNCWTSRESPLTPEQPAKKTAIVEAVRIVRTPETNDKCKIITPQNCLPPYFYYNRISSLAPTDGKVPIPNSAPTAHFDLNLPTYGLTVGAVAWLYYYERMGIFKILGALLDDYNYKGKYTISGRRTFDKTSGERVRDYSTLIDFISTLHRLGISSNLRDRITLYQRVLGVNIENNLGINSERNTGFMETFNRLIDYQLEYYKAKQLAQAIQAQSSDPKIQAQARSSVATQTSIRDTISVLKQHFEPLQYGRNQINTFLGIATVHATICLIQELKTEIGIPNQYDKPEEFIPAAYDILVAGKNSRTINVSNRFIIYDNCASYGYRLLTDIEAIDLTKLQAVATGSVLDVWLNDIEGWVEGYRNAYKSVTDKVETIV